MENEEKKSNLTIVRDEERPAINAPLSKTEKKKLKKAAGQIIELKKQEDFKIESFLKTKTAETKKLRYQLLLIRLGSRPTIKNEEIINDIKSAEQYILSEYDEIKNNQDNNIVSKVTDMLDLKFNVLKQYCSCCPQKTMDEIITDTKVAVEYINN